MRLDTIGQNLRKCRIARKLRQEDLAELTGLSTNYIGSLERGEKLPSLETFINIINQLHVSADTILADVTDTGYVVKSSQLTERLEQASPEDRMRILDVVNTLLEHPST